VHPATEIHYDSIWLADWTAIKVDEQPLEATSNSPGVCNAGGSQQGCYDTDEKLINGYHKLLSDLSGANVPSEFSEANSTIHKGVEEMIQGLADRDDLIASQSENGTFTQSNHELALGEHTIERAQTEFKGVHIPRNPPT
jgi:hypothetical protein